jgi:ubiquinone/menaquinone biosynthesis C-methylase UbiE
MKVADFGAGSGAYALAIAAHLENSGTVYAIDIQKDLLRRIHNEARARGLTNVEILGGDLEAPHGAKLADVSVDLVLISNLLFQADDANALIAEAKRVVKDGGRVAIIDWSESFGGMGPRREDVVTKDAALALAREAGLSFQKEFAAGAHHYGLVFRKGTGKRVRIKRV